MNCGMAAYSIRQDVPYVPKRAHEQNDLGKKRRKNDEKPLISTPPSSIVVSVRLNYRAQRAIVIRPCAVFKKGAEK